MHPDLGSARFDIAAFGELLADPSRVAMLLSLMDGCARPASELAAIARVAPSTASAHLGRLEAGGLVRCESAGRHRYYRLAGDQVADALEVVSLQIEPRSPTGRADPARATLAHARTCYKHLAGRLGVAWMAALESRRWLAVREGTLVLAPSGLRGFASLGLAVPEGVAGKPCLDWTERRHHLGGPLGTLLTQHLLSTGWLERRRETRALRVTTSGRAGFAKLGVGAAVLDGP